MSRRYHLHIPGLVYGLLTVLVALAAVNTQNNLLFWVFGVLLSGVMISGIVSGVMMMGVQARRLDPGSGAVGEPLVVGYEVHNRNRIFPIFNIHIEERIGGRRVLPLFGWAGTEARGGSAGTQPRGDSANWRSLMKPARAWIMHIGPQESVHGEAVFWPTSRGEARFDQLRIWTTFPFGLVKKSVTISQPQHTLIFPRLYELKHGVLNAVTPAGPMGNRISQHPGAGDDYHGMREYRPGDSMRHIAWKRMAGLDQLVSIERSRPSPPKIRVILNLLPMIAHDGSKESRLSNASAARDTSTAGTQSPLTAQREMEEKAISLAGSILYAADRAGMEVGLTVLGVPMAPIPIRRSHWHLSRMMSSLAAIDLDLPPRRPAALAEAARERLAGPAAAQHEAAGLIVVHPGDIETRVLPASGGSAYASAWHLSARQLESLIAPEPTSPAPASSLAPRSESRRAPHRHSPPSAPHPGASAPGHLMSGRTPREVA
jgi:uncharacterized protein (DUF58 family)